MVTFAERLIGLRKQMGLSQQELANRLKMTRGQISMYEIDRRKPDLDTVKHIADFFNVTTDYLTCRTDDPPDEQDTVRDLANAVGVDPKVIEALQRLSPEDQQKVVQFIIDSVDNDPILRDIRDDLRTEELVQKHGTPTYDGRDVTEDEFREKYEELKRKMQEFETLSKFMNVKNRDKT